MTIKPNHARCATIALLLATTTSGLALGSSVSLAAKSGSDASATRAITCPKRAESALALPADGVAKAAEAALAAAPRSFKALDVREVRIISAQLGYFDAELAHQCRMSIQDRSVAVTLQFPKMAPDAALERATVFLARFKQGYAIWEIAPSA